MRQFLRAFFRVAIFIAYSLLLYGCGSGCYQDDMTSIQQGLPSYTYSSSVTVTGSGNYTGGYSSAGKKNNYCQADSTASNYNNWVNSNVAVSKSVTTTINLKVTGGVSMCNGKQNSQYNTLPNTLSPECTICSNYYNQSGGTTPSCCSSCTKYKSSNNTCYSYCENTSSSSGGIKCPFGSSGDAPAQCDGNCIHGSKYFIKATDTTPTILTYNILPNDKVTFFVDAANNCGILNSLNKNTQAVNPDVNRFSPGNPTYGFSSTATSCPSSDSDLADSNAQNYINICTPYTDGTGYAQVTSCGNTYCWQVETMGLMLNLQYPDMCYLPLSYNTSTNYSTPTCFAFADKNAQNNPDNLGQGVGGIIINTVSTSANGFQQGKYNSIKRTFYNTTSKVIPTISANIYDQKGAFADNHGGYTVYVNHESCRSNGLTYTNAGALQAVLVPPGCTPNSKTTECAANPPQVIDLSSLVVTNCNARNLSASGSTNCQNLGANEFCPAWSNECSANDNSVYFAIDPTKYTENYNGWVLWLRAMPMGVTSGTASSTIYPSSIPNSNLSYWQTAQGAYNINIGYGNTSSGISNVISEIINDFSTGILQSLSTQFTNIICTGNNGDCTCAPGEDCATTYIGYLRILLIFYIMSYGLLFIMGMVQISQADLIVRIIKIGFVITLTTPNAWGFFYNNFFMLFLDGGAELVAKSLNLSFNDSFSGGCGCIPVGIQTDASSVLNASDGSCSANSVRNPFCFVDYGFNLLFANPNIWKKLATFMFLNPLTFILFWYMVYGLILYIIAIFKAVVTYLSSVIAIAVLLLLAPIFIPFVLFSMTRSLFENWLQYLIYFTLSPILLLIGLNILTMIMYLTIQQVLDFTVCWDCRFPISIPSKLASVAGSQTDAFCLEWFVPFGYSPGGGGSATQSLGLRIEYLIFFIIILNLMKNYGSYVQNITQRINGLRLQQFRVTGRNQAGGGYASEIGDFVSNMGSTLLGQDAASKSRREGAIRERLNNRSSGAEVTLDNPPSPSDSNNTSANNTRGTLKTSNNTSSSTRRRND